MSADSAQSTPRPSRTQIITHRGRSFVTGLRWHPLGSVTGYMKEARQFGRENNLDIVAIRRTPRIIQAGFVSRSDGVTKGMYSLAATLAGQLGDSWLAAWRVDPVDDRFAVVAVHDGGIIPGCDLIGTESEIRRRIAQQRSRDIEFNDWYLPPEFGMGGTPIDVEELLHPGKLRREYRLRPLVFGLSKAELSQLVLAVVVVGAGIIGWMQWSAYQERIEQQARLAAEQARLAELARLQAEAGAEQSLQALDHPWAKRPSVASFVTGCSKIMYQWPPYIEGWEFVNSQCDGVQVLASYTRTGNATAQQLIDATAGYTSDRPAFFDEGNSATLKVDISLQAGGDEDLADAIDALAGLSSWFHSFAMKPTLKEVPVVVPHPAALPGEPAPPPPPPPQWKQFELHYVSDILPFDSLSGAPTQGLRLREIRAELKSGLLIWSVTGDLYAK
ncbi:type 4b pilus protein PilO2 [Pseudomonas lopnurensis]|uniref:type 4b pilus protein PilO2 n=1 Tax=Pseudomonas lopnurensis TaxID=1477517 RepID=UPI0028AC2CBE|nr:type 4b pilus protein PilO2 [Pseudomonas lopnurensis]